MQRRTAECVADVQVRHDVDAGYTGETDRMTEWSEGAVKSCNAGADFVLEAHEVFSMGDLPVDVNWKGSFGDIPVPPVMEEIVVVIAGGGEADPAGTNATADHRACASASVRGSGRDSQGGLPSTKRGLLRTFEQEIVEVVKSGHVPVRQIMDETVEVALFPH